MCMEGNATDEFKVSSESVKEYIESETDSTEAQPGGSCAEGEGDTVVRKRHCRG